MKGKGRYLVAALALLAGIYFWSRDRERDTVGIGPAGSVREVKRVVPEDVRIRVEVLNATTTRGLARRGTFYLRDLGFDVVSSGNSAERHDTTVVIVRNGRMDWGELAAKALSPARVEARPDTSRYLDLTILLGAAWRPPAEAFHP